MSRFADPRATRTVDLGACECPDTPHSSDWVKVRSDLSDPECAILLRIDRMSDEEQAEALVPFIAEWNLLGLDGEPAAIDAGALFALKGPTLKAIGTTLGEVLRENLGLPNPQGAPSRGSSRGSASRTRTPSRTPGT